MQQLLLAPAEIVSVKGDAAREGREDYSRVLHYRTLVPSQRWAAGGYVESTDKQGRLIDTTLRHTAWK